MVAILLVEKNGNFKSVNVKNFKEEELYKKVKFRKPSDFAHRTTWKWGEKYVSVYARDAGRPNTENKYDFPPPIDSSLFFGMVALVAHTEESLTNLTVVDLIEDDWKKLYEKLMGGFEELGEEDSYSEEEDIPKELLTKQGYMKDGFVVDDGDVSGQSGSNEQESDSDKIESEESDEDTTGDSEAEYGKESSECESSEDEDEEYDDEDDDSQGSGHGSELAEEAYAE